MTAGLAWQSNPGRHRSPSSVPRTLRVPGRRGTAWPGTFRSATGGVATVELRIASGVTAHPVRVARFPAAGLLTMFHRCVLIVVLELPTLMINR
jgi:hypothetical protein